MTGGEAFSFLSGVHIDVKPMYDMHASKPSSYVKRVNKSCAVSCLLVRLKKSLIHMQVEEDQAAPRSPKWDTDESVQLCVVLLAA